MFVDNCLNNVLNSDVLKIKWYLKVRLLRRLLLKNKRIIMVVTGVAIGMIALVSIAVFLGGKKMSEPTLHDRQVEFLKKHEDEMIQQVRKQTTSDEKVIFHWNTVEQFTSAAFTSPVLTVKFDIHSETKSSKAVYRGDGYSFVVDADVHKLDKINDMWVSSPLREKED